MLPQLPEPVIRDTVAAVFSDPAYRRHTLLQRIGRWLLEQLQALFARLDPGALPPYVFWLLVTFAGLAILLLVSRSVYQWRQSRPGRVDRFAPAGRTSQGPDAWTLARGLAAAGDYTAAAHALYAGILHWLAGRGDVTLHESKTIGDYVRDLSTRPTTLLARFREFARSYEIVIYRLGRCDRERYERLQGLAQQIVEQRG